MTENIYLIPKSFPCEICGTSIEVKISLPELYGKFGGFKCNICGFCQRMTYYGKYFGMIIDVR